MKVLYKNYSLISVTSAIIAITIQSVVFELYLIGKFETTNLIILNFVAASSLYIIIYKGMVWLYEKYLWKYLLRELYIHGKWYHELISQSKDTYIRRGCTYFNQNFLDISVTAQNYNEKHEVESRTMWNSKSIHIDEDKNITITYIARRAIQGKDDSLWQKEGIMYAHILLDDNNIPKEIVGEFMDVSPSTKRGTVTWKRTATWAEKFDKAQNF